jgi:hypothetical protein
MRYYIVYFTTITSLLVFDTFKNVFEKFGSKVLYIKEV